MAEVAVTEAAVLEAAAMEAVPETKAAGLHRCYRRRFRRQL